MASNWNRKYGFIFVAHLIVALWAGLSFALFPNRFVASIAAGLGFLLLNLGLAFWMRRDWRRSLIFWSNFIILFIFTLPMLITRLIHPDIPWDEVRLLGLTGPLFHRLSTAAFMAQIVMTLVEGFLFSRNRN